MRYFVSVDWLMNLQLQDISCNIPKQETLW